MKNFIFIFLLIFINLSLISAVSFSPSYLIFNLSKGQEDCQKIIFSSDSKTIIVSDKWAENKDMAWNPNLFNESADKYDLVLKYPKKLSAEDKKVNVCLSGKIPGEYHGIILLKEEQVGNSVIQMGVWIKAVISDTEISNSDNKIISQEGKSKSPITGAVIGSLKNNGTIIIITIIGIVIVGILIMFIRNRNKRKNEWRV